MRTTAQAGEEGPGGKLAQRRTPTSLQEYLFASSCSQNGHLRNGDTGEPINSIFIGE